MLTTTLLKPLRMSPTLRASPRGEVPSLSRRRGVSLTFRYSHFYRLHTSLYLNTSSIQLNSYAYKLLSPLSRPSGRQLSPRRASLLPKVNSSCLHTENLSYTHPNAISKATATSPSGEVAANHSKNLNPNTLNKHPVRYARRQQHARC